MDFGALGLDGLVGPEDGAPPPSQVSSAPETMPMTLGSRPSKRERSGSGEDARGDSKMAKTGDFTVTKTMPLHQGTPLLRSNSLLSGNTAGQQEQMLSFASNKLEVPFLTRNNSALVERGSQITGFPYYQNTPSAYTRAATGYGSGSLNPSMHGPFSGVRSPFTQAQWIELEQQALIYKYINANAAVPSNLLIPLKKSINPYGLSYPSAASYVPSYGWGTFHLGYSGSTDPEPGRCRRTDGKKWRCSRDAVPEQKYCERHINRGRHRSRKPVEGQTGHAASGTTTSNVVPTTSSMSTSVITSGISSNSFTIAQQLKNLQPDAAIASADPLLNRVQDPRSLSMMPSTVNLKSNESSFGLSKQDVLFEDCSQSVFGLVTSDSLLNPSQRSSYLNCKSYGGSFLDFGDQDTQDQHPLRQFIDDWPKDESNRSVISWPEELKSDWTQLSMSIPMANSEFSSSSSSPTHEKFALSPLRLSREFDLGQTVSEVNTTLAQLTPKQTNWIPIPWKNSMGGPLGEALTVNNTPNSVYTCKNQSSLNLLTEGWDGSPQLGSSPTGVLQRSTFCSLSNSSSVSSPITDNKKTTPDGVSLCDDVLGSTHVSSSPFPSL